MSDINKNTINSIIIYLKTEGIVNDLFVLLIPINLTILNLKIFIYNKLLKSNIIDKFHFIQNIKIGNYKILNNEFVSD